jgi:hypothetical protein
MNLFRRRTKTEKMLVIFVYIPAWINIILAFVLYDYLNGDAQSGHIKNGHYFLCAKGYGCHEVAAELFKLSYWQFYSVIPSFLIFVIVFKMLETNDMAKKKWPS